MASFLTSRRFRLIVLVLLAACPVLGLVVYNVTEQHSLARHEAQKEMERLVQAASSEFDDAVQVLRRVLPAVAEFPAVLSRDPSACSEFLAPLAPSLQLVINLGAVDSEGSHSAGERTNEAIKSGSKGFIGKPYQVAALLESVRKVLDVE